MKDNQLKQIKRIRKHLKANKKLDVSSEYIVEIDRLDTILKNMIKFDKADYEKKREIIQREIDKINNEFNCDLYYKFVDKR